MKKATKIALSLGGNLGDVASAFDEAIEKLEDGGVYGINCSSAYKTPPVDCTEDTPVFLNMALSGFWKGSPEALLCLCKKLEKQAGRPAEHERNLSRTLDIDIVLFGEEEIDLPDLRIPHPDVKYRFFVLIPLVEIEFDWKFPGTDYILCDILGKLSENRPREYKQNMSGKLKRR